MGKIDGAKESLAMLKVWLGVIVGVVTALIGWLVNKFKINDDILIILAIFVILFLLVSLVFILKKINKTIKEITNLKK